MKPTVWFTKSLEAFVLLCHSIFDAWSDEDKDNTKPVEDDDTENNSSSDNDGRMR